MKKYFFVFALFLTANSLFAQEFLVLTTVESVVPGGLGRSRMILQNSPIDSDALTTERTDGVTSEQDKVKRKDAKADKFEETKMLNFYSLTGINFQNIASNDAIITDKLNKLAKEGWKLTHVTRGVESDAGKDDGTGIFITRFIFYRE